MPLYPTTCSSAPLPPALCATLRGYCFPSDGYPTRYPLTQQPRYAQSLSALIGIIGLTALTQLKRGGRATETA